MRSCNDIAAKTLCAVFADKLSLGPDNIITIHMMELTTINCFLVLNCF